MIRQFLVNLYLMAVSISNLVFKMILGNPYKSQFRLNIYLRFIEYFLSLNRNQSEREIGFSIVIPFHNQNRGSFLLRALDSIGNTGYKNLEVIVIDQTKNLKFRELRSVYSGKLRIVQTESVNSSKARNLGKDLCENEFIVYLDDDNYVHKNHFSLLKLLILRFPYFSIFYVGSMSDFTKAKFSFYPFFKYALFYRNLADTNTFAFHRESLLDFQIWDPYQVGCEDWRMLADLVCAGIPVKSFPILSVFLTSDAPNRVTDTHDHEKSRFRAVEKLEDFFNN